jgi:hypothetical protein
VNSERALGFGVIFGELPPSGETTAQGRDDAVISGFCTRSTIAMNPPGHQPTFVKQYSNVLGTVL